ncbi:MAG: biopolymer transporter ExbD [Phycisphaerales bacterium]|nr:biopolymer transporter ExbD [Phycisphaerales bacterium]
MSIVWAKKGRTGKRLRGRTARIGSLPLTSMIDVVFLLLIYFLVTANFAQPERDLPSALQTDGEGARSSDLQPQIVEIRMLDGAPIFVLGDLAVRTGEDLRVILEQLPKEAGVAVRSVPDAPISAVAEAMQASFDAGFIKRSYVPRDEN